jgi:hypothetical protein
MFYLGWQIGGFEIFWIIPILILMIGLILQPRWTR